MRYIKKYQVFESDLYEEDIKDILLELTDTNRFNVKFLDPYYNKDFFPSAQRVIIIGSNDEFSWDLVRQTILRLVDYLDDSFFSVSFRFLGDGVNSSLTYNKNDISSLDSDLSGVTILKEVLFRYKSDDDFQTISASTIEEICSSSGIWKNSEDISSFVAKLGNFSRMDENEIVIIDDILEPYTIDFIEYDLQMGSLFGRGGYTWFLTNCANFINEISIKKFGKGYFIIRLAKRYLTTYYLVKDLKSLVSIIKKSI
jgi:hypothetical protein